MHVQCLFCSQLPPLLASPCPILTTVNSDWSQAPALAVLAHPETPASEITFRAINWHRVWIRPKTRPKTQPCMARALRGPMLASANLSLIFSHDKSASHSFAVVLSYGCAIPLKVSHLGLLVPSSLPFPPPGCCDTPSPRDALLLFHRLLGVADELVVSNTAIPASLLSLHSLVVILV